VGCECLSEQKPGEQAGSEAVAAPRSDRRPVRELAVLETENLERTGIFRFAGSGIVAAGNENRRFAGRHYADLVRKDSNVQSRYLFHLVSDGSILIDPMHGDAARIIVGDQGMRAGPVDTDVQRARSQRRRRSVRLQRSGTGIDAQRARTVLVAGHPGTAVAPCCVENVGRGMGPSILHIRGQR